MRPDRLRARAAIVAALRRWFERHGYLEVHPPTLVPSGALEEHLEVVRVPGLGELHTSPEMAMKRALAAGLWRIYAIAPCFRAEERGPHHALEFTMLEWYRAGAGTAELMDEVEELLGEAARAVGRPPPRLERRRVGDLLEDTGDPDAWFLRWVDEVEPRLRAPTIAWGYPAWQAALARLRGGLADRFEVYLEGVELANAFAEELDPDVIRERWEAANRARAARGRPPHPVDEEFLDAVGRMPRCAGIALGVDRLVLALTGAARVDEVRIPARTEEPP